MTRWVFLRGWGRESRHWGDFIQDFHAFHPDAQIVALDLPGAGSRCHERSPAAVASLVDACRASVELEEGTVRLLGLSLGAMVCADWAARHPSEVEGAVLINTSMRPFSPARHRLRPRNYATLARTLWEPDPGHREARVLRLTSRDPDSHPGVAASWASFARERPVARANALRQLWAAARYRAPRETPATRLLVLGSKGDALVDVRCSLALARVWSAALAIHPTAGHDLTLDDGPWVAAQVRRWLEAPT